MQQPNESIESIFENEKSAQKAIYQVSQHPGFPPVIGLLQSVVAAYKAPLPRKPGDERAFETYCIVRVAIEDALQLIGEYITAGERLTQIENGDLDDDGKESGHPGPGRSRA